MSDNDVNHRREALRAALRPGEQLDAEIASLYEIEANAPQHAVESDLYAPLPNLSRSPEAKERIEEEHRRSIFLRTFTRENLSFEDMHLWRVRAAYRWTREVAEARSLISGDELISERLDPLHWTQTTVGKPSTDRQFASVKDVVVKRLAGVSILPPAVGKEWRDENGVISTEYAPEDDDPLKDWIDAFVTTTLLLGIPSGSEAFPDSGRWGLQGLDDPKSVRWLFPSPLQIATWEEILVREAWDAVVGAVGSRGNPYESSGGLRGSREYLRAVHGLCAREQDRTIRMARRHGADAYSTDIEQDRALSVARLERFVTRVENQDPRAALAAMKHMDVVKGVSRSEAEDFTKSVGGLIKELASKPAPLAGEDDE